MVTDKLWLQSNGEFSVILDIDPDDVKVNLNTLLIIYL